MKKILILLLGTVCATAAFSQAQYENTPDPKHPEQHIMRGIINKYLLQNDESYKWYASSQVGYKPDTATLTAFEKSRGKYQFILFGGTWCEDTQSILPKFFRLQELSGVEDTAISFFGVNRQKKTLSSIADAFNITNVPTIIVMKDGKEVGRVVEYGKTGKWDKEVAELLK